MFETRVSKTYRCAGCGAEPVEIADWDMSGSEPREVASWYKWPHEPYSPICQNTVLKRIEEKLDKLSNPRLGLPTPKWGEVMD